MKQLKVIILVTSDIHGNILPISYIDNSMKPLGLSKIATFIKKVQNENENTILIDNGDLIQGTPLTYYYCKVNNDGANPIIKVLNYLKYDAAVIGNHEFNYGKDILNRAVDESDFPWMAANILSVDDDKCNFGKPYIIKKFEHGPKVGILGVTTKYIPNWEDTKHIQGLAFEDAVESTDKWVRYLKEKEKVDIVIVSYHGGFEKDIESGKPIGKLTGENQAYEICEKIKGIDVLVTGHQHKIIENKTINDILLLQPGSHGKYIGIVKLSLKYTNEWRISDKSSQVVTVTDLHDDSNVLSITRDYEYNVQQWLDKPIGTLKGSMIIDSPLQARLKDNPFIEFINKVQMKASGANISCTSLFTDEAKGLNERVTMREIVASYIYPNTLRVMRVTGMDIKLALERSACYFEKYDGKRVRTKKKDGIEAFQPYNYDMWEGIEYKLDISKDEGARVVELNFNGKPIDLKMEYEVVMNNYRAAGGGEYEMFKDKPVIKDISTDVSELIANYVIEEESIKADVNNNWEVIY